MKDSDASVESNNGLSFTRWHTTAGVSPFDQVAWDRRSSVIAEPNGKVVFRMDDIEVPLAWSQLATDIVVSKYFRKAGVNGGSETSVRQLITRVTRTIRRSGEEQGGYFATTADADIFEDELTFLLLNQYGAFNSPVWFNVGLWHEYGIVGAGQSYAWKEGFEGGAGRVERIENAYERPQSSACFIQSVDDSLDSIMQLMTNEVMLFKYGSGTGTNFSNLRGEKEMLSGGGYSSGLMSFLEMYDRAAGAIKSGGTTRRAAKLVCLDMDHPDITKFIGWKVKEERKARTLIAGGYPRDFNGEAYSTVSGQNSNNSVRITDEFMKAVGEGGEWSTIYRTTGAVAATYKATDLWRMIAECAWECADPGIQFDTTINKWHTVPNSGRINASNPCCMEGTVLVETCIGRIEIQELERMSSAGKPLPHAIAFDEASKQIVERKIKKVWIAGATRRTARVWINISANIQCTPDHRFLLANGEFVEAQNLRVGDELQSITEEKAIISSVGVDDTDRETPVVVYDMEVEGVHNFAVSRGEGDAHTPVIVHNSEYMHLDDSACNLASLNLTKFLASDRDFNVPAFRHAVRIFFVAQEILVDLASYPTEKIAQNSHDFRPLGLGYANLGTLLMLLGLPYDSDEGRSLAGAITAIMTGHAYKTSAEMAQSKGSFAGFPVNRAPMLEVMVNHEKEVLKAMDEPSQSWKGLWAAAVDDWDGAVGEGVKFGYRNAQASVLAPTGCLVAGTMVATDQGLVRIEDLGDVDGEQWQDINVNVQTDDGPKRATKFYVNGVADVIEVETSRGLVLRGTAKHQIKVVNDEQEWQWKRLDAVRNGDVVPLAMNQIIGNPQSVHLAPCPPTYRTNHKRGIVVPKTMTSDLAELVGAFLANGSFHKKGLRFSMFGGDGDAVSKYAELCHRLFNAEPTIEIHGKYTAICMNSTQVRDWWAGSGFTKLPGAKKGKGYTARTPDAVLATNDVLVYGAYLRGLFTSDGTTHLGVPSLSNKDKAFMSDVQTIMMALGIPTTMDIQIGGKSKKQVYRIRLASALFCETFAKKIGFSASRKEQLVNLGVSEWSRADFIPISKQLLNEICPVGHDERKTVVRHMHEQGGVARHVCIRLLAENGSSELARLMSFFYDTIHDVKPCGQEPTYDLSVPENVTYVANSFISHNTIGLLMDCDTTGVEPDFALVKFKKLAGGGYFKIVNGAVEGALETLGYTKADRDSILRYINGTMKFDEYSHHCIDRQNLLGCGLGSDEIDRAEKALVGAFSLDECFSARIIGDAAFKRLNVPANGSFLRHVGFSPADIENGEKEILGHHTIEGAKALNLLPHNLAIFDCANRCGKYGKRFIEPMGHIKMMAAVQPFISGAISKTVNLPNEYTIEDIADLYETSWRMGLKSVAIYRDGSKSSQPLSTGGEKKDGEKVGDLATAKGAMQALAIVASNIEEGKVDGSLSLEGLTLTMSKLATASEAFQKRMGVSDPITEDAEQLPTIPTPPPISPPTAIRLRLPTTRYGVTQEAVVGGHKLFLRTGEYSDGRCGEIFVDMHKEGAAFRSLMNCFAISVSMGLQHGIPLETFVEQFTFTRFEPQGNVTGDPHVKLATSIVDYIFRNLGINYCDRVELAHVDPSTTGMRLRSQERRAPSAGAVDMEEMGKHFDALAEVARKGGVDAQLDAMMGDAPVCDVCGHITVRNGTCFKCMNCGNSMGCS